MKPLAIIIIVVIILLVVFGGVEMWNKESMRRGGPRRGGPRRGHGRGWRGRGWGWYGLGGPRYWQGWPYGLDAGWYGTPWVYDLEPPYLRDYANIRSCGGDPTDGRPLCTSKEEKSWEVDDRCRAPGMYGDAEYVWRTGPDDKKCYQYNP